MTAPFFWSSALNGLDRRPPGDDLEKQIEEHRDMSGTRHPFVKCRFATPDYDAFNEDELGYYLYFRESFLKEKVLISSPGYVWLLTVELINDRDNPRLTMEHLVRLFDVSADRDDFPNIEALCTLICDYAAANGLPLPRRFAGDSVWMKPLTSEVLLPTIEPVPVKLLRALVEARYKEYQPEITDEDLGLFDAALPRIDSYLKERTGDGVVDTYCLGKKTLYRHLFTIEREELPYFHEDRELTLTYTDFDESLNEFLTDLLFWCRKVASAKKNTPSHVSDYFTKDLRTIVSDLHAAGGPAPGPAEKTISTVRILSKNGPFVAGKPSKDADEPGPDFGKVLARCHAMHSVSPCGYVPSQSDKPDISKMPTDAVEYYLYWRDGVRRKICGKTDNGYLWLYMCELINEEEDESFAASQLELLAETYEAEYQQFVSILRPDPVIGLCYLDYTFVHFTSTPHPWVYPCAITAADAIVQLLAGRKVKLTADLTSPYLDFLGKNDGKGKRKREDRFWWSMEKSSEELEAETKLHMFDDNCANIVARTLLRIDRHVSARGGYILEYCQPKTEKAKINVFQYQFHYRYKRSGTEIARRDIPDLRNNKEFIEGFTALAEGALRSVRNRKKKAARIKAFGIEVGQMIAEETEAWFASKKDPLEEKEFTLDSKGIETAESDLKDVTTMMSTGEAPEEGKSTAKKVQEKKVTASDDPWESFAEKLDLAQRVYLDKALAGTVQRASTKTEDGINDLALETIGDTVIEHKTVHEEYADALRKALRKPYRE